MLFDDVRALPLEARLRDRHLASMLTTGNSAPGKSVFQFMGLLIGISFIKLKVANRYKIAISYRRIELVFDRSNAPLTAVKNKLQFSRYFDHGK